MKNLAIATAFLAFPAVTFAGGMGNSQLMDYLLNFDPSTAGTISQPVVGPIGSMIQTDSAEQTTSYVRTRRYRTVEAAADAPLDRSAMSSSELATAKQDEARAKLLRLRALTR